MTAAIARTGAQVPTVVKEPGPPRCMHASESVDTLRDDQGRSVEGVVTNIQR
jgi:hypothetical protein